MYLPMARSLVALLCYVKECFFGSDSAGFILYALVQGQAEWLFSSQDFVDVFSLVALKIFLALTICICSKTTCS